MNHEIIILDDVVEEGCRVHGHDPTTFEDVVRAIVRKGLELGPHSEQSVVWEPPNPIAAHNTLARVPWDGSDVIMVKEPTLSGQDLLVSVDDRLPGRCVVVGIGGQSETEGHLYQCSPQPHHIWMWPGQRLIAMPSTRDGEWRAVRTFAGIVDADEDGLASPAAAFEKLGPDTAYRAD